MNVFHRATRHCDKIWLLLLLLLPAAAQAQFTFTTNNVTLTATVTGYTGPGGAVTIPNTTNGYRVTALAMDAFLDKTTITSVTIGTNVGIIGYQAFGFCSGLTNVTMPDSVTNVGQYAFEPCSSLTSVTLSSRLGIIPSEMFGDCSSLVSITIPSSVTNIQSAAFDNCTGLLAIYFLGNEPTPGANMFHGVSTILARVYYMSTALNWGTTYGGLTTVELFPSPITDIGLHGGKFGFTFNGTNDQVIVVEATTNLVNANWQLLVTNTLSGTSTNFTDSQWQNYPHRFYRVFSP